MKKSIIVISFILLIVLSACGKDNYNEESSISLKFKEYERITKIHSITLDSILFDIKKNHFFNTKSSSFELNDIETLVVCSLNEVLKKETHIIEMIRFKENNINKFATKTLDESPEQNEPSPDVLIMLEETFTNVSNIQDPNTLRNEFISILSDDIFKLTFTNEEQELIIFSFALYIDSYEYWGENLNEWEEVIGNNVPMSPAERDMYRRSAQNKYATSDATGAVVGAGGSVIYKLSPYSLIVSWIYGAITSSLLTAIN